MEDLLTLDELAAYLKIPKVTVYEWRSAGRGPRAVKVGKHLRFRWADVAAWLEQNADAGHLERARRRAAS